MQPSANAVRVQPPWAIAIVGIIGAAFGLTMLVAAPVAYLSDERAISHVVGVACFLFGGGFSLLCIDMLRRSRDQVAADDQGLWYLPKLGSVRFIAWTDVGRVRADDVMQRLIVTDRSSRTTIRLEYQLDDFETLRELVLQRTDLSAQLTDARVFHRTVINKVIMGGIAIGVAAMIAALSFGMGGGDWHAIVLFGALPLLQLVAIARDPATLEIGCDAITIRYPGWKRSIPFADIAEIASDNDIAANGNVWAKVAIVRRGGKPIALYRFREGSLALAGALRAALRAHREGDASAPSV